MIAYPFSAIYSTLFSISRTLRNEGLAAALEHYDQAAKMSLSFGILTRSVNAIVPLREICREILCFDSDLQVNGLGEAARAALQRVSFPARYDISSDAREALSSGPFLAFGNHETGVEPALFSATIERDDVFYLAAEFIARLGPGFQRYTLPITGDLQRTFTTRQVGIRARVATAVERLAWSSSAKPQPRANLEALERAANLILTKGHGGHIFPVGSTQRSDSWMPGLGYMVKRILNAPSEQRERVRLIPVLYRISNRQIMASGVFASRPTLRAGAAALTTLRGDGAPLMICRSFPATDLHEYRKASASAITRTIHERWSAAFPDGRTTHGDPMIPVPPQETWRPNHE